MRFLRKLRTQIDGNDKVTYCLSQIRGVGMRFAQLVVEVAGINPDLRVRDLTDEDLNKIEKIVMNPVENGIPNQMVNRPKDIGTAEDVHITGNKLEIAVKRDIDRIRKIKSYRSKRHHLRLKVRGRRTSLKKQFISPRKLINLIKKIRSMMMTRGSHELVMEKKYLAEFLGSEFLDFTNDYTIKDSVKKKLEERGIKIQYWENFIKFYIYDDSS
ncbi:MAG: 30S ribosomal protein S13 [Promethearchaeota archaeon]